MSFYEDERIRVKNKRYNEASVDGSDKPVEIQIEDSIDITAMLQMLVESGYTVTFNELSTKQLITIK